MTTREEWGEKYKLSWRETFPAMAADREDWSDLDATVADGLEVEPASDPIAARQSEIAADQIRTISKQGLGNQIVGPEAPHD